MCNLHWCYTFCTGVTLFALVLHLNCTALSQSESSNFFMYIALVSIRLPILIVYATFTCRKLDHESMLNFICILSLSVFVLNQSRASPAQEIPGEGSVHSCLKRSQLILKNFQRGKSSLELLFGLLNQVLWCL